MNHVYRVIWNEVTGTWQAVTEVARGRGKTKSQRGEAATHAVQTTGARGAAAATLSAIALATVALFSGSAVWAQAALPTGGNIVAGTGSISQSGAVLTVTQGSAKLAADWQSFNIGQGNTVNFVQPSSSAVALNRVLGNDVSVIQGALNANGQVFLVNPNGVLFTPTAQVNVGSIVASTLNISTADFMAGNYKFDSGSRSTGKSHSVINHANINATGDNGQGGSIALVAARVINTGTLNAPGGNVLLGVGSKVTLDLGGPVKLRVDEGALDVLISNGGAIRVDGGLVYLSAKAAGDLTASVINHTGVIDASSLTAKGGKIVLEGDAITLGAGSQIDATGATGGGTVLVGGDWQGSGTQRQATTVTMQADASIDASATHNGDGGKVVLWADLGNTSSTLPARKSMIPLETDIKAQTTKQAW